VIPLPPTPVRLSAIAAIKPHPEWAACLRGRTEVKSKDPARDVAALSEACAKATGTKLAGKTLSGVQADQDAPQTFPFEAKAGRCYRVYGEASEGITDLDVAVEDSAEIVVAEDSTTSPGAVVLEGGAICFRQDDAARVVVSVGMGKGSYALQIWSD
jgi:hypothetical protein